MLTPHYRAYDDALATTSTAAVDSRSGAEGRGDRLCIDAPSSLAEADLTAARELEALGRKVSDLNAVYAASDGDPAR